MNDGEKNKIKKERKGFVGFLLAFFYRDFFTIILCLLVLTACLYTIGRSADIQNKCNERWIRQLGIYQDLQENADQDPFKLLNLKDLNISSFESEDI